MSVVFVTSKPPSSFIPAVLISTPIVASLFFKKFFDLLTTSVLAAVSSEVNDADRCDLTFSSCSLVFVDIVIMAS